MNTKFEKTILYSFKGEDFNVKSNGHEISAILSSYGNTDFEGDVIRKGAFDDFLSSNDSLVMLRSHRLEQVIGRWNNLRVDGNYLRADGVIAKGVQLAEETAALVDQGMITGVSVGMTFNALKGADGGRTITKAMPLEASIVTIPVNEQAMITDVKAFHEARQTKDTLELVNEDGEYDLRNIEKHLKRGGLTRTQAAELFKIMQKHVGTRDPASSDDGNTKESATIKALNAWAIARNQNN